MVIGCTGSVAESPRRVKKRRRAGDLRAGTQRVTLLGYDFRDRQIATESGLTLDSSGNVVQSASVAYPPVSVSLLDNNGDTTATLGFNGGALNASPATAMLDAISAAGSAAPGAVVTGLIAYSTSQYDAQNRDYQDQTYSVDPSTGTISATAETSLTFYGHRGNVIETVSPTGLVTKDVHDSADRLVMEYTTDGGAVNNGGVPILTWANAGTVANDIVISQTAFGYDADGNQVETVHAQRFNTDPILGTSANGSLFEASQNANGGLTITPKSITDLSLEARISYSASYYDIADRQIASVDAGTNPVGTGGVALTWQRPVNAPLSVTDSNFAGDLINLTSYNAAGWVFETADPRGIVAANFYNNLGETTQTIAAYDPSVNGGNPTAGQNQTTDYTYDGNGDQTSMTAVNVDANTGAVTDQTTDYVYGVTNAQGSAVNSNDLLYQTVYPSVGVGQPPSAVSNNYNVLGQVDQSTDRNGNVHQYTYDTLGRQTSDIVVTLGAGVDGSVRRIDTAYNNQGLPSLLTSYADTAGTVVVNQVENFYNGLGQITAQYQSVSGGVDTSTTPYVGYTYSSPSNGSLLTSMTYPNGRTIDYNYSGSNLNGALDAAIGRLDSISDGANSGDAGQVLEQYSYLGLGTIVARNHPQTGINLTLVGSSGSIGSGGDQYVGLDRFGRIANQNWVNSTGATVDGYTYTYDQNSNVTAKNNVLNSAYSETYTYDSLNRLTAVTRGGAAYQSWNLDSQGNWSSSTIGTVTQTRTANAQNQITSVSGLLTPVYDSNGNMTTDQNGNKLVYDAWNRLVSVTNSSGQLIAKYSYNAMGWRVTSYHPTAGPGGTAINENTYYSASWQRIETRVNGTANSDVASQYIWSAAYVDGLVLRDSYASGTLQANSRVYALQDADWNVTALVGYNGGTNTWAVSERFVFDSYGQVKTFNASWQAATDTLGWQVLAQGRFRDLTTGLDDGRARIYSASLGRWISQDPAGYIDGANTYQYELGGPTSAVDPTGLATPATQPGAQRNQYIANPKSFDLIISLIPLNAPARTTSGNEGGGATIVALKDLAARDGVPFKVASNTFELVADIKAAAAAKGANAKSSKSVPVKVLIVNHGNASEGPGFGYGGTHWTPLFPDWNAHGGIATDPDLNTRPAGKQPPHFVLWALKGLVASAVFTGCSMAATREDKVLTQDLANLLQAGTITDFTADTEQTVTDSGLVITPGEKVLGRFAFTVHGGTVKK